MLNTNIDVAKFKRWARDHRGLAEAVCLAQAFAEIERERVNAYVRPIFDRFTFVDEDDGTPITDPDKLYCADLDTPEMKAYDEAVLDAHEAHGWKGERGHCPALTAECLLTQAENALLDALSGLTGADFRCATLELREKGLDWALTVCLGTIVD